MKDDSATIPGVSQETEAGKEEATELAAEGEEAAEEELDAFADQGGEEEDAEEERDEGDPKAEGKAEAHPSTPPLVSSTGPSALSFEWCTHLGRASPNGERRLVVEKETGPKPAKGASIVDVETCRWSLR